MIVYRLGKKAYCRDLSGKGAELYGGRWNSKGTALLYTSASRALAFAEVAVHLPFGLTPRDYGIVSIEIPDAIPISQLREKDLPPHWRDYPHGDSTQQIGDAFAAAGKSLVLRVPSAVVPGDFNYLLNPAHPQMKEVTIMAVESFDFDSRFVSMIASK